MIRMKQLLNMPLNSYFFRGKASTATLRLWLNRYMRDFSVVTSQQEVSPKPIHILRKQESIYLWRRFSSYSHKSPNLMDFDFWFFPKLPESLKALYYFIFVLRRMDDSFSLSEFTRSTATALQVVTTLLSELRFSELEGLLTQKCKEEVEKNLQYWSKDLISVLAIRLHDVVAIYPCEVAIISDESNNKVFVEIRVIHYVRMKYSSKFDRPELFQGVPIPQITIIDESSGDCQTYGVYNSKFIREFTEGVSDQWSINAINVKSYSSFFVK